MNEAGHAQYSKIPGVVAEVFSHVPADLAAPCGRRDSRCIEGLWQGATVARLANPGRIPHADEKARIVGLVARRYPLTP